MHILGITRVVIDIGFGSVSFNSVASGQQRNCSVIARMYDMQIPDTVIILYIPSQVFPERVLYHIIRT